MSLKRQPTFNGCGSQSLIPHIGGCKSNGWIADEAKVYSLTNTVTTDPFSSGSGDVVVYANKYSLDLNGDTPLTQSFATCRKLGWQAPVGSKTQHGRFGFTHPDGCRIYYFEDDPDNPGLLLHSACSVEPPVFTIDTTRYRTITVSGWIAAGTSSGQDAIDENDPAQLGLYITLDESATVNRFSGVVTQTNTLSYTSGSNFTTTSFGGGIAPAIYGLLANAVQDGINLECADLFSVGNPDPECAEVDPTQNRWNFNGFIDGALVWCGHSGASLPGYGNMTFDATTVSAERYWNDTAGRPRWYHWSFDITLSDPYTDEDVINDVNGLLQEWDLDKIRTFRTDQFYYISQFIEYDEVESSVDPKIGLLTYQGDANWVDPNAEIYSGVVLGKPLPFTADISGSPQPAIYDAYYDPKHRNLTPHIEEGVFIGLFDVAEPVSGAYVSLERGTHALPDWITKSPDVLIDYPWLAAPGPFAAWQAGRYWKRIWAETYVGYRPSQNWDRPYASSSAWDESVRNASTQICDQNFGGEEGSYADLRYAVSASRFVNITSTDEPGPFYYPMGDRLYSGLVTKSLDAYWNDENEKYDFVRRTFTYDYRTYAEASRYNAAVTGAGAHCFSDIFDQNGVNPVSDVAILSKQYIYPLWNVTAFDDYISFSRCRTNLIAFYPAGHSSSFTRYNAKVITMTDAPLDTRYSSYVNQWPAQLMTNIYWRPPLRPCSTASIDIDDPDADTSDCGGYSDLNFPWEEDNGEARPFFLDDGFTIWYNPQYCQENFLLDTLSGCNSYYRLFPAREWVECRTKAPTDPCGVQTTPATNSLARPLGDCSEYIYLRTHVYTGSPYSSSLEYKLCEYCNPPSVPVQYGGDDDVNRPPPQAIPPFLIVPWDILLKQEACSGERTDFIDVYKRNGVEYSV